MKLLVACAISIAIVFLAPFGAAAQTDFCGNFDCDAGEDELMDALDAVAYLTLHYDSSACGLDSADVDDHALFTLYDAYLLSRWFDSTHQWTCPPSQPPLDFPTTDAVWIDTVVTRDLVGFEWWTNIEVYVHSAYPLPWLSLPMSLWIGDRLLEADEITGIQAHWTIVLGIVNATAYDDIDEAAWLRQMSMNPVYDAGSSKLLTVYTEVLATEGNDISIELVTVGPQQQGQNVNPPLVITDGGIPLTPTFGEGRCCLTTAGNVDGDIEGTIDLSDLLYLAGAIFLGGPQPVYPDVANVDGGPNCVADLSDVLYLADYVFLGGEAPASCQDNILYCN